MTVYRCNVVLPYTTNLPRDVAVNAWHINVMDDTPNFEGASQILSEFYDVATVSGGSVKQYLSNVIKVTTDACRIDWYPVGVPGPPVYSYPFDIVGAKISNVSMPLEVALVTSLTGQPTTGVPIRRRRGRIYVGPLNEGAMGTTVGNPLVLPALVTIVTQATERLVDDLIDLTGNQHRLAVYSVTNAAAYNVVGGWVDNAWDTQRRRELEATVRGEWGSTV